MSVSSSLQYLKNSKDFPLIKNTEKEKITTVIRQYIGVTVEWPLPNISLPHILSWTEENDVADNTYLEVDEKYEIASATISMEFYSWPRPRVGGAYVLYHGDTRKNHQMLEKRREQLKGDWDQPIHSVRKTEKEEIMKGVMRRLFGSDFKFVESKIPIELYKPVDMISVIIPYLVTK